MRSEPSRLAPASRVAASPAGAAGSSRRSFLARSLVVPGVLAPAALSPAVAATAAVAAAAPAGGLFAGTERLRIGVVGCGGRGTGAALLAAAASPAVRVVALGDVFADQVDSSADVLAARIGDRFECPAASRFVGADAYRQVIDAGVDLVILAGPPHVRPPHLEAAVAAGKHVYCEKPAAIDVPGAVRAAAAAARGRAAGLSLASGLCFRHDPRTAALVGLVRDGAIGRILAVQAHAAIGLPWRRPVDAAAADGTRRLRNWISSAECSGGHLVEHHVEAIDRALWLLGDIPPAVAEGRFEIPSAGRGAIGDCPARTAVRYRFADGRSLEASVERCERSRWRIEEAAIGTRGSCDLVAGTIGGRSVPLPAAGPARYAAVMDRLVAAVLSGRLVHEGESLCRSTLVAVMGRVAAESGRPVAWADVARADVARADEARGEVA